MPPLRNSVHERFAVAVASGNSKADAYREAYPHSVRWQAKSVHEAACKLATKVSPRIDELMQVRADESILSRDELARFFSRVVRTPVGEVAPDSDMAQEVDERPKSRKVKMPSKIEAARELARLLGYYAPEKSEQTVRFAPDADVLESLDG